jgi:serine/threonine-protein kinase
VSSPKWDEGTTEIRDEWLVSAAVPDKPTQRGAGQYTPVLELASGGMATVYLALYEGEFGFSKVCALKKVHPHLIREHEFAEMFLDEASIAARIDHPHVCHVLDFGRSEETLFLAMEFLIGAPLSEVFMALAGNLALASSPRRPFLVARIIAGLCEGLHAAHELMEEGRPLGIVHRDINPSNLFVLHDGTVRIVDFGIAKAANRLHQTETGKVRGTYAYVSPEQLQLQEVDRRSDVWALGIVLWELLAGRRLFRRESPVDTIRAVTADEVEPPSGVRPEIPNALDHIVARALQRERSDRYQTAREMALDLEHFLGQNGETVPNAEIAGWLEELIPDSLNRSRAQADQVRRRARRRPEPAGTATSFGEDDRTQQDVALAARLATVPSAEALADEVTDARGDEAEGAAGEPTDPAAVPPLTGSAEGANGATSPATGDAAGARASRGEESGSKRGIVPAGLAVLVLAGLVFAVIGPEYFPVPAFLRGSGESETEAKPPPSDPSRFERAVEAAEPAPAAAEGRTQGQAGDGETPGSLHWHTVNDEGEGSAAADEAPRPEAARRRQRARRAGSRAERSPSREGTVEIKTQGGWAEVSVAGTEYGRTPQTLDLPAGHHTVVLRPYGDEPSRSLDVDVKPGRKVVLGVTISKR